MPVSAHATEPIRVAHKPKRQKRLNNVFYDDRGFPDQSDKYDYLLHSVDGGPVLRKLRHPAPDLEGPVDPSFLSVFNPDVHESQLREELAYLTSLRMSGIRYMILLESSGPSLIARAQLYLLSTMNVLLTLSPLGR